MIAFFDITEGQLYIFDRKFGILKDKIPFSTGEGFELRIEGTTAPLPYDIEETYVSLPLQMLNFRGLELQISDVNKIREVLPFELEGLILGDPESVVIDACVVEEQNDRQKVLAVYTDKSPLKGLLEGLRALNMDPRVVTSIDLGQALDEASASLTELSRKLLEGKLVEGDGRVERALKEIEKYTVNLRRDELSYTKDVERTKKSLRFTAAAALLLMLFFSADMALKTVRMKKETAGIENEILKMYSSIFPDEKPENTSGLTYKMKAHLKDMKDRDAFTSGVSPLELLLKLQSLKLPGLALTDISLDRNLIVLKGGASSLSGVQEIKGRLERFLSDVNISETGQSVRNKIAFTITAKRRQSQ